MNWHGPFLPVCYRLVAPDGLSYCMASPLATCLEGKQSCLSIVDTSLFAVVGGSSISTRQGGNPLTLLILIHIGFQLAFSVVRQARVGLLLPQGVANTAWKFKTRRAFSQPSTPSIHKQQLFFWVRLIHCLRPLTTDLFTQHGRHIQLRRRRSDPSW